jgi:hypothetical protein
MTNTQLKNLERFIGRKIPKTRSYCRECGLGAPLEISKGGLCSICKYALKNKKNNRRDRK